MNKVLKLLSVLKPFAAYLLILWACAIVILSSTPNLPTLQLRTGKSTFRLDYLIHFCEYAFMAFFALLAFSGKNFYLKPKKVILIISALLLFALIDEFHQKIIPGRKFNPKDLMSNIAGISIVTFLWVAFFRKE